MYKLLVWYNIKLKFEVLHHVGAEIFSTAFLTKILMVYMTIFQYGSCGRSYIKHACTFQYVHYLRLCILFLYVVYPFFILYRYFVCKHKKVLCLHKQSLWRAKIIFLEKLAQLCTKKTITCSLCWHFALHVLALTLWLNIWIMLITIKGLEFLLN